MKKIEKLSLNRLTKNELTNPEMNKVKGGETCECGCCYAGEPGDPGWGGSSAADNGQANCSLGGYYNDPWSRDCPSYHLHFC